MPFINLYHLYCAFMESNELRHEDLIEPIKAFAKQSGTSMTAVLTRLQYNYVKV
jgi:hypothetical protein